MNAELFAIFFQHEAGQYLNECIDLSLREDGPDLTTLAVFDTDDTLEAVIVAKEDAVPAGLPVLPLVLEKTAALCPGPYTLVVHAEDGVPVKSGDILASFSGSARILLRAERVMLNFLCHLSGIASLVRRYKDALEGSGIRLLDTRKTLPGLRYPEKYAVLAGGGLNHRKNLAEMLMLKDNHIDAAGGITRAVTLCRETYSPCPPVEVECRTLDEVREAAAANVSRIMLDNMDLPLMEQALALIPEGIETEISGGVSLENIRSLAFKGPRRPDFISVGRLTHSAPYADFSMRIQPAEKQ